LLPLAVAWTAYCAVLTLVELGVLSLILGSPGNDTVGLIIAFFLLNLSPPGVQPTSFLSSERLDLGEHTLTAQTLLASSQL